MAYTRKPKVFKVSFEEPNTLAGLTLTTRALSVKDFAEFGLKLADVSELENAGTDRERLNKLSHLLDSLEEVRVMFADKLISWNMEEEDGSETPASVDGVMSLSDEEFYSIIGEWLSAVGGVEENLGKDSDSGEITQGLSQLMEPLSPSPVS